MKRIAVLFSLLLALTVPASAQLTMTGVGGGFGPAAGGGGAVASPLFGANNGSSTTTPYVISGITFSTGTAVVGILNSRGGAVADITAVTINTGSPVSATKIGTGLTDTGEFSVSLWYAAVTAGTGTVSITNGATVSQTNVVGWMLTGLGSSTPTANVSADNYTASHADPQSLPSLTVSSGGVGVAMIGGSFHAGTNEFPTVWANASGSTTTQSGNATGNTYAIAGATLPSAGSFTVTATGVAGGGWNFNAMLGAAWQ